MTILISIYATFLYLSPYFTDKTDGIWIKSNYKRVEAIPQKNYHIRYNVFLCRRCSYNNCLVLYVNLHREPGDNQQHQVAGSVAIPMCQAMMAYDQGNYSQAVDLLYPLRYRVVDIGGSDAQVSCTEIICKQNKIAQTKLLFSYARVPPHIYI